MGSKSSYSKVTDFAAGVRLSFRNPSSRSSSSGCCSDAAFRDIGEKASKDTRIKYKSNGEVSYDKDGKGGADAIVFAKLTTKPDIEASDLVVLA